MKRKVNLSQRKKGQPKPILSQAERKALMDHINRTLAMSLGTVGDTVEFRYNGRKVQGQILEEGDNWIICKLLKDYRGTNDLWEKGSHKEFWKKIIYNHNYRS